MHETQTQSTLTALWLSSESYLSDWKVFTRVENLDPFSVKSRLLLLSLLLFLKVFPACIERLTVVRTKSLMFRVMYPFSTAHRWGRFQWGAGLPGAAGGSSHARELETSCRLLWGSPRSWPSRRLEHLGRELGVQVAPGLEGKGRCRSPLTSSQQSGPVGRQ